MQNRSVILRRGGSFFLKVDIGAGRVYPYTIGWEAE
jgi:hypothetical protein